MRSVSNDVCNVAKFFCRNTATLPTQHDPTLFASSALSCVQIYDNKTFFQTVSEIATPFPVGGKSCFFFYFSITINDATLPPSQHNSYGLEFKAFSCLLTTHTNFRIRQPTSTVLLHYHKQHRRELQKW